MQTGSVLAGRFEIERLAEAGGVGTVYRARDRETGEPVAIKVLRLEGREHAARFAREVLVLSELPHPAIVRFVAQGLTGDARPFVAMEWVEGESLRQRLMRGRLSPPDAITLVRRVAEGLAVTHARGIVHRDINPNNLLLPGGRIEETKIVDFGMVRLGARAQTLSGIVLGTPGYMAPEQARGQKDIDARADIFALGCVMFKALTGTAPFEGQVMARLAKVLFETAPRIRDLRPDLPWVLDELVSRLLAQDREERPRDGAALIAELDDLPSERRLLAGTPPGGVLTIDEQRLVSIVLAVGSAEPSPRAEKARAAGARFDARVELLADGTIVAALSSKASARDQAKQGARCALALRDVIDDAPIALATGRAAQGVSGLLGEVIERATELLHANAPPGPITGRRQRPIAIDTTTAGLLDAQFEVVGDGGHLGLRRERPNAGAEAARTLLGKPTQFVGREREIGTLEAVFRECAEEGMAHAVLVTAPSGVGKSRLRHEFIRRVRSRDERVEVWMGRGDPMSAGSPLGMIAQIVRGTAGVQEGETLRTRQAKLTARLSRHLGGHDLQRITEFLGEIAGIRFPEEDSVQLQAARRSAVLMGDQMRRAWEDFVAAECRAQAVLVVLEDLHWGDLPTVGFLDGVLRNLRNRSLMILALAQPDVRRLFPQLWAGHPMTELQLGELSRRASEKLVRHALGNLATEESIAQVIDRAAGNAFYLEELIRSVAEGRDELPPTVLAMVQARLAALDPEARRVLRAASVFGETFWRGGVASLLDEGKGMSVIATQLEELIKREFITPREHGRYPEEYVFRHAIVREAAYGMLTEADRVLGHRLAGAWLERAGESDAMALAEQLERGGEPERAVALYERAATQALEGNDFGAVIARVRKGIASGAKGEQLGALLVLEAQAYRWRGEFTEVEASLREALKVLRRGSAVWYEAAGAALSTWARLGHHGGLEALVDDLCDESIGRDVGSARVAAWTHALGPLHREGFPELAARLFACVEEVGIDPNDPSAVARMHQGRATQALGTGDPSQYLAETEAAAQAFELAGDLRNACLQWSHAGYARMRLGEYATAEATLREALLSAQRMALPSVAVLARQNLGITLAYRGALHEARAIETVAVESASATGEILTMAGTRVYLAEILLLAGSLQAAERAARDALATLGERLQEVRMYSLAILAQVLLGMERVDEAVAASGEAMALIEQFGVVTESGELARLVRAEVLQAAGDSRGAREAIRHARQCLLARADLISSPALRKAFLENVAVNARTLHLALEWAGAARAK